MKIYCNNENALISDIFELALKYGLANGLRTTVLSQGKIIISRVDSRIDISTDISSGEMYYLIWIKTKMLVGLSHFVAIAEFAQAIKELLLSHDYFEIGETK